MKDTEKGWPKGLQRGNELKKDGFALSDLVTTSDRDTFPDGFFLSSFTDLDKSFILKIQDVSIAKAKKLLFFV